MELSSHETSANSADISKLRQKLQTTGADKKHRNGNEGYDQNNKGNRAYLTFFLQQIGCRTGKTIARAISVLCRRLNATRVILQMHGRHRSTPSPVGRTPTRTANSRENPHLVLCGYSERGEPALNDQTPAPTQEYFPQAVLCVPPPVCRYTQPPRHLQKWPPATAADY